jgi:hypothetical protein
LKFIFYFLFFIFLFDSAERVSSAVWAEEETSSAHVKDGRSFSPIGLARSRAFDSFILTFSTQSQRGDEGIVHDAQFFTWRIPFLSEKLIGNVVRFLVFHKESEMLREGSASE